MATESKSAKVPESNVIENWKSETLRIVLDTNVSPNDIVMTRSMLESKLKGQGQAAEKESSPPPETPKYTTEYPYISFRVKYDKKRLLSRFTKYEDVLKLFFVKDEFNKEFGVKDHSHTKMEATPSSEKMRECIDNNIRVTLRMLMPVSQYEESYKNFIQDITDTVFSLKDAIPQAFKSSGDTPARLTIDSRSYQIERTVWLNDVINHPVYRQQLIDKYKQFTTWRNKQQQRKNKDLYDIAKNIKLRIVSERKKAMVSLHNYISENQTKDPEYLNNIKNKYQEWAETLTETTPENSVKLIIDVSRYLDISFSTADISKRYYYMGVAKYLTTNDPSTFKGLNIAELNEIYKIMYDDDDDDETKSYSEYSEYSEYKKDIIGTYITPLSKQIIELDKIRGSSEYSVIVKSKNDYINQLIYAILTLLTNNSVFNMNNIDEYIKIIENADVLTKRDKDYKVIIPRELTILIDTLHKMSKKYIIKTKIYEKYYKDSVRVNFDDDDEDMKTEFKSDISNKSYLLYGETLRKLCAPYRESSNPNFQEMVTDYVKASTTALEQYLDTVLMIMNQVSITKTIPWKDKVKNRYLEKGGDSMYLLYNGITILPEQLDEDEEDTSTKMTANYEIYVMTELFIEHDQDRVQGSGSCEYRGNVLGDMFLRIMSAKKVNRWDVFSLRAMAKLLQLSKQTPVNDATKKGGRQRHRRSRKRPKTRTGARYKKQTRRSYK